MKLRYAAALIALMMVLIPLALIQDAPLHATHVQASGPNEFSLGLSVRQYTAALDVARVFGRSTGCAEADPKLIGQIATESIKVGLDPRILAATIAVESNCNQYATSSKGAIGLTQVVATTWKDSYNFDHDYNLLNPTDNIHVGASILSGLIKQYGQVNGIRRYNGLGTDCPTCDTGYVDKISALAARR